MHLPSYVRHGDDLPEGALGKRADRVEALRRADDPRLGVHVQAQAQGVGPRGAARQQLAEERVVDAGNIAGRTGAVDRRLNLPLDQPAAAARNLQPTRIGEKRSGRP